MPRVTQSPLWRGAARRNHSYTNDGAGTARNGDARMTQIASTDMSRPYAGLGGPAASRDAVTLRAARRDDLDAILRMQRAAIAAVRTNLYPHAVLRAWAAQPTHHIERLVEAGRYFVAVGTHGPAASAGWEPADGADTAVVRGVFVAPDRAGGGLGRRMIAHVEAAIAAAGRSRVMVPAALNAVGFYRRLGYVAGPRRAFDAGGVALEYCEMRKRLAPA